MELTIGYVLKLIRIKCGLTLRTLCIERDLDPVRYSMIERDVLRPNTAELDVYLDLVGDKKKEEGQFLKLKKVDPIELRMFVREMILPEIVEAVKDHSFADGLKEALGLK